MGEVKKKKGCSLVNSVRGEGDRGDVGFLFDNKAPSPLPYKLLIPGYSTKRKVPVVLTQTPHRPHVCVA